jgi:hypothetical protein
MPRIIMKNITLAILIFLLLPNLVHANDNAFREEINTKLTQLSVMMGDSYSHEYPEYRYIQIFKYDKEHILAAVAIFTIEGLAAGNNYTQFMAVFASVSKESEGRPRRMSLIDVMAVGGKGLRGIEFDNIKIKHSNRNIFITVPVKEYGQEDAMCCPSIKSEAQFIFQPDVGSRLKEITKKKKK